MNPDSGRKQRKREPVHPDRSRLLRFWPIAVLGFGSLILFAEVLVGKRYLWDDVLYFYYPYHYYLFAGLRGFFVPLWNPYAFAGTPFAADVQSGVFYPLNWILAAVSSPDQRWTFWLVEFKVWLHVFGAAVGAWALGRQLGMSLTAALIVGAVYGLGGYTVTHTVHVTLVSALAWLPLLLMFELRSVERHSSRDAARAGLVLGMMCLAGHPQAAMMAVYALALHRLIAIAGSIAGGRWREAGKYVAGAALTVAIGLLVSAAAYLPAIDNVRWTVRASLEWSESAVGSLPASLPLLMLVPKFFGSIAGAVNDTVRYWGGPQRFLYWETCVYVGILPLMLASIAMRLDRRRVFFFTLGLVSLLLALGPLTPLYRIAYEVLPGFNRFRVPARLAALFVLATGVMAGYGLDEIRRSVRLARFWTIVWLLFALGAFLFFFLFITGGLSVRSQGLSIPELYNNAVRQSGIALVLIVLSVVLVYLNARAVPWAAGAAAGIVIADLLLFGWNFSRGTIGPEDFYPRNNLVRKLQLRTTKETFRVNTRSGNISILRANQGMIHGIELIEGFSPLKLSAFAAIETIDQLRRDDLLNSVWRVQVDTARGFMTLDSNPRALPRAKIYWRWFVEPDAKRALAFVADRNFDFHGIVVLDSAPFKSCDSIGDGSVRFVERGNDRMKLRVEVTRPAVVLLADMFYPRWRAWLDGKPIRIMRANGVLRAVAVPAGVHDVVLGFDTAIFWVGGVFSVIGASIGVVLSSGQVRLRRSGSRKKKLPVKPQEVT